MHPSGALFRGQGGSGVWDMTLPLMGNLGAKSTSLILANFRPLQTVRSVASGGKFHHFSPDKENTAVTLACGIAK